MRRSVVVGLLLGLVLPALSAAQPAPSGEAVYKQHCAGCHEGSLPRLPTRATLRAMAPEAIDTAPSAEPCPRSSPDVQPGRIARRWR